MKVFFSVCAAILFSAVIIIGYLRMEARYDEWYAKTKELRARIRREKEWIDHLNSDRDFLSAEEVEKEKAREESSLDTDRVLLALTIHTKPLPLSTAERQELANLDADTSAYAAVHRADWANR